MTGHEFAVLVMVLAFGQFVAACASVVLGISPAFTVAAIGACGVLLMVVSRMDLDQRVTAR